MCIYIIYLYIYICIYMQCQRYEEMRMDENCAALESRIKKDFVTGPVVGDGFCELPACCFHVLLHLGG